MPAYQRLVPALLAPLFALLFLAATPLRAAGELNYGPLVQQFDLTLEPGRKLEVLGPLFSHGEDREWERWALSPFFRYSVNHANDTKEWDFIYPAVTYDRSGSEYKLKVGVLTSFTGGDTQEQEKVKRFTLFPVFYYQRAPDKSLNYMGVFPLYGNFKNRLQRHETRWALWPLYITTRKRDIVTHNYVYPFFHLRSGIQLKGWQLFPFYGNEVRHTSTITNDFGDPVQLPGHRKSFVLWPFYHRGEVGIDTTNQVSYRVLLPFYYYSRSPAVDVRTWLWPLFSVIDNREKGYRELQMPWPFVVFTRGPGETTDRIFPFYSRSRSPTISSGFILWPFYKVNRIHSEPLMRERSRLLYYLYSNVRETNTVTQTVAQRIDVWPLFAYRRDHEGRTRYQALALLEPILPLNHATDHLYSPLWSIWRNQHNPQTGAKSQSFLWNLFRRDKTPKTTNVSLLFGLFQYHSTPEGRRVKLFFIPFKKAAPPPA